METTMQSKNEYTNAYSATFRTADDEIDFLLRDEVRGIAIVGVDRDDRTIWYFRLDPKWNWEEAKDSVHNMFQIPDYMYDTEFSRYTSKSA